MNLFFRASFWGKGSRGVDAIEFLLDALFIHRKVIKMATCHGSFTLPETDSDTDSDSDSCPVQK